VTARNALERRRMWREVHDLRRAVDARWELLGGTPVMQDLRRQIAKVAPTRSRVLITGDSGTGKELIARAIHRNGSVSAGPFVKVNCAAIPPELIESELFGHERGAFTGAIAKKRGLFEVADGGTIFLDEIGDMALPAQAKVLRVLQTGEFTRVGGEKSLRTDCRVVAATNRDLEQMVKDGGFREDLFYRLNVVQVRVPALRERRTDIPALVKHFVAGSVRGHEAPSDVVRPDALEQLVTYDWPGNVRQLRNEILRAAILTRGRRPVGPEDLSEELRGERVSGGPSFRDRVVVAQRVIVEEALNGAGWNKTRAARTLGLSRQGLLKMMRRLGVPLAPAP
jgi:DNA-binding NtrC family response regulator